VPCWRTARTAVSAAFPPYAATTFATSGAASPGAAAGAAHPGSASRQAASPATAPMPTLLPVTTELLGWASSFILVLTIAKQVLKQWREDQSAGVSRWLFVGQLAASAGFTAYSWLVHNWVFVVTNALMLVNALLGLLIVARHRRRAARRAAGTSRAGRPAPRTA
jgi:MtN3 and saliva related transmembrane protein